MSDLAWSMYVLSETPQQSACRKILSMYNVMLLKDCLGWATCHGSSI